MTPEKRVQSSIMNMLAELQSAGAPVFFERRQAGGYSYKMGIPDLYAVYNGRHIEIEVKAPGKTQSTMQIKFMEQCKRLNILYVCADDVKQVYDLIKSIS